eukprot:CAMPEP_0184708262 /NCGR_PEP_ID=MMETSP0313-20130426/37687_1 /TAXON_ID=2792 /ORGANISM="Porphyridium aerugineum, Strain SAG 1380-2" /LENGTH=127 /DNA_ID=CAMNT_0027169847 /DNA_START=174 /DNA_END=557 /DNA_ORIENTATION=-
MVAMMDMGRLDQQQVEGGVVNSVPFVQAETLAHYVGKEVVIAGKVTATIDNNTYSLSCGETNTSTVKVIGTTMHLPPGSEFVQVHGKVLQDGAVEQIHVFGFGSNFDVATWNKMVAVTTLPEYSTIF